MITFFCSSRRRSTCWPRDWSSDVCSSDLNVLVPLLTFQDFSLTHTGPVFVPVAEGIGSGEVWRLFTPAFLHFGVFLIVFNILWLWEMGRRVADAVDWRQPLVMVLVTGVADHGTQPDWSSPR